jgi:hypothetical protein
MAQLTPEDELFYEEAMRTLAQAESAINTAKRAPKGEVGKLTIGFLESATYAFLRHWGARPRDNIQVSSSCSRNSHHSSKRPHSTQKVEAGPVRYYWFGERRKQSWFTQFACSAALGIRFTPVSNVVLLAKFGVSKRHNRCSASTAL